MKIVIIGNGVAGTTAARHIRKLSDHEVVMVSDETLRPFSRTALMYVYMGHVRQQDTELYEDWFWEKNRIRRVQARVEQVDFSSKKINLSNGQSMSYDALVLATGSKPNRFGWPGQDLRGVQGLYHLSDLESLEQYSKDLKHGVVVGGGLIGIELAEMLHARHIGVTFLVREASFWDIVLPPEESEMVNRSIRAHGIDLRLETELREIVDDGTGRVGGIFTNKNDHVACGVVGLTVGVSPNVQFLRDSGIELDRGILCDEHLRTSAPDVYAVGDCVQIRQPQAGRRPIEAIWYTGKQMGETVAHTICGQPKMYNPRLWFNSAKFFDIEYQVYGDVPARTPEGITSLYWEHAEGKKAIRINFETASGIVRGFHLMGIRYRHEVCERWLLGGAHIHEVLQNLGLANFDPEFFEQYESALVAKYNQLTSNNLQLRSERGLRAVLAFLNK
jgi:3-phenylpropionate/trans-cinnamate dioxygenase ferredoxin reductase component